jgi:5'-nucleotidase
MRKAKCEAHILRGTRLSPARHAAQPRSRASFKEGLPVSYRRFSSRLRLCLLASVCAGLSACGGDDGSPSSEPAASLTLSGTAATGSALANAQVAVRCADGSQGSATTRADGGYSAAFNGKLPCVLEADAGALGKLHSLATGSGSTATANITPLTEAVVGKFSADTVGWFAGFNAAAGVGLSATRIAAAQAAVKDELVANAVTIPASVSDFLAGALVAASGGVAGNEHDQLLDALAAKTFSVKLVAMNDFHGAITAPAATNGGTVTLPDPANAAGTKVNVGGAAYVATAIKALRAKGPNSVVVGAGDMTGASPFVSSATHDEASVDVLNRMGLEITSVGNHEFDYGRAELLRKQNGGCFPVSGAQGTVGADTCFMDAATGTWSASGGSFSGAKYKYLAANVVDQASNNPLLPATAIKRFGPVAVGFIGLTLKGTTELVAGTGISGLSFLEESATINSQAKSLKAAGVQAVVVLIHQGGVSTATTVNDTSCPVSFGDLGGILDKLSSDIDVVVSGHSHQEYVCNYTGKASGKRYVVTQTGFYGGAVTDINLGIQLKAGVTSIDAATVPVIQADNNAGVTVPAAFATFAKDADIAALVDKYVAVSNTLAQKQVGTIGGNLMRALFTGTTNRDESAEGVMGSVMADAYLYGTPNGADFAVVNAGGVRADLTCAAGASPPCPVTYAQVNTVAPFANTVVKVTVTGAQVIRLLEQQWEAPNCTAKFNPATLQYGRLLQVSGGLTYSYDNSVNAWTTGATPTDCAAAGTGHRVVVSSVKVNGVALDLTKTYTVSTNNFLGLGSGGDNFNVLAKQGTNVVDSKVIDLDAMIAYFREKSPVAPTTPRITRLN